MCRRPTINFFFFSLYSVIAVAFFSSCGNIATEAKAVYFDQRNQDSISAILDSIHAPEKTEDLKTLFQKKAGSGGLNGCVLIAQNGQILYKEALGYVNFKTKEPLKINTAFQLASASKPFTAAAILLLMERGKLNLTDKVEKYIPGFPYPNITIEMLLTHRSGLNDYVYFGFPYCTPEGKSDYLYKGETYDNYAVVDIINTYKPGLYYNPGRKFGYCNTNYALLATIVENISGLSFADFMRINIFEPLKMKNTWVYSRNSYILHKNIALGHKINRVQDITTYGDDVVGDKGVFSTIDDMFKWDQALYSEKLLKKTTLDSAFRGYSREKNGKRNYGLGWRLTEHGNGKKDIYHNGWWHGFNITFFRRPYDDITIIILSNINNKVAYQIHDVLAVLYKNYDPETVDTINYEQAIDYMESDIDFDSDTLRIELMKGASESENDSNAETPKKTSADLFLELLEASEG